MNGLLELLVHVELWILLPVDAAGPIEVFLLALDEVDFHFERLQDQLAQAGLVQPELIELQQRVLDHAELLALHYHAGLPLRVHHERRPNRNI